MLFARRSAFSGSPVFGLAMPVSILAALLVVAATGCAKRQRIVVITLDTLRYDSFAGSAQDKTTTSMPLLAARAKSGLVFECFYASTSQTQPTHASLFTGLQPWRHGVSRNGMVLNESFETLAERLRGEGFETYAVVASFPLHRQFGFAQGFEKYEDTFDVEVTDSKDLTWNDVEVEDRRFYSMADATTEKATRLIDEAKNSRQFYWFHYYDPHDPYGDTDPDVDTAHSSPSHLLRKALSGDPAIESRIEEARKLYEKDIAYLDKSIDRLLTRLESDRRFDTTVVITSDHGESFGNDGSLGHARRVSRAQIHVPLVILSPSVGGRVRHDTASTIDLANTILDLAGIPDASFGEGRSLISDHASTGAFGMRRTFAEETEDVRRIDGTWTRVPLVGNEFYAIKNNAIFSGSGSRIRREDVPNRLIAEPLNTALRKLFDGFQSMLAGNAAEEIDDRRTRRALIALGYLDE